MKACHQHRRKLAETRKDLAEREVDLVSYERVIAAAEAAEETR